MWSLKMVDSKEVEQLRTDLELVTKTAEVLATKLGKISQKVEELMASLDTKEGVSAPVASQPVSKPPPVEEKVEAAPQKARSISALGESSTKAGRLLDSFLTKVQTLSKGKDVAEALSQLRDQVMETAEVGFHPAFHEMGRYANQLKNTNVINDEEREALIEKIYNWKERIG